MTPPDSDEVCIVFGCVYSKGHREPHVTERAVARETAGKPGSDAREVAHETWCASKVAGHECDCPATKRLTLPLPLAQRILAALEDPDGCGSRWSALLLAAELRAVIGK